MTAEFLRTIKEILESSILDLRRVQGEKIVQDLMKSRLSARGIVMDSRVILQSEEYPDMEVDLLGKRAAIELKVNPKFYDGIGQVVALRELYGLEVALVQIWRDLDSRVVKAMDRLSRRLGLASVLVDLKTGEVIVLGR